MRTDITILIDGKKNKIKVETRKSHKKVAEGYTTIEKAKLDMYERGYRNPRDIQYIFNLEDGTSIPIDNCQKISGYEWVTMYKGKMIKIIETEIVTIQNLGYFVFNDGDTKKTNRDDCKNVSRKCIVTLRKALEKTMKETNLIYKYSVGENSITYIKIITRDLGQIHLCFNGQLMDLNQMRKEDGIRCLPFIRDMDKYSTFYIYAYDFKNGSTTFTDLIDTLVKNIAEEMDEEMNIKYKEVEFMGRLQIKSKEVN